MRNSLLSLAKLTIVSVLSVPIFAMAEDSNLFPAGSMEEVVEVDGVVLPVGWKPAPGKVRLESDLADFRGGERSLRLTLLEAGQGWVRSQVLPVKPGVSYEIGLSMRLGSSGQMPFCGVRIYDSADGWVPAEGYLIESTQSREWVEGRATFTTSSYSKWVYIGVFVKGAQDATVHLDEIVVSPFK